MTGSLGNWEGELQKVEKSLEDKIERFILKRGLQRWLILVRPD